MSGVDGAGKTSWEWENSESPTRPYIIGPLGTARHSPLAIPTLAYTSPGLNQTPVYTELRTP
jgi:hypothetical protein